MGCRAYVSRKREKWNKRLRAARYLVSAVLDLPGDQSVPCMWTLVSYPAYFFFVERQALDVRVPMVDLDYKKRRHEHEGYGM